MDLAKDDYVVSMDAVQPHFDIIARNTIRPHKISKN